ncbi:MAG: hypothetical protein AAF871_10030 [Pseudomonadota bacterium]
MVENYTNAFLVTFGVLVFMALFGIWVIWGLIGAALTGAIADRLITKDFRGKHRRDQ